MAVTEYNIPNFLPLPLSNYSAVGSGVSSAVTSTSSSLSSPEWLVIPLKVKGDPRLEEDKFI